MSKTPHKKNFYGSEEEHRTLVPEQCVDEIIKMLEIDPNAKGEPRYGYLERTRKVELWDDLAISFSRFNHPASSSEDSTPTDCVNYAKKMKKKLKASLDILNRMKYAELVKLSEIGKESVIPHEMRNQSLIKSKGAQAGIFPQGYAEQVFKANGKWPSLCAMDDELPLLIKYLENFISYLDAVIENYKKTMKGRGNNNVGKNNRDNFIIDLCRIYKKYSGKEPKPWLTEHPNETKSVSPVILLIKIIIPYTYLKDIIKITDTALEKRLR